VNGQQQVEHLDEELTFKLKYQVAHRVDALLVGD